MAWKGQHDCHPKRWCHKVQGHWCPVGSWGQAGPGGDRARFSIGLRSSGHPPVCGRGPESDSLSTQPPSGQSRVLGQGPLARHPFKAEVFLQTTQWNAKLASLVLNI